MGEVCSIVEGVQEGLLRTPAPVLFAVMVGTSRSSHGAPPPSRVSRVLTRPTAAPGRVRKPLRLTPPTPASGIEKLDVVRRHACPCRCIRTAATLNPTALASVIRNTIVHMLHVLPGEAPVFGPGLHVISEAVVFGATDSAMTKK